MHDLYISNVFSYVARKSWWLSFQNKKLQLIIYFGAWNLVQAWHWTPQKNRGDGGSDLGTEMGENASTKEISPCPMWNC